ncbi:hypothetical protein I3760_04G075500 [Carya illinoinensis]|nr:hypothetical protein I3760_04G075500 [Carya illinoinensis]
MISFALPLFPAQNLRSLRSFPWHESHSSHLVQSFPVDPVPLKPSDHIWKRIWVRIWIPVHAIDSSIRLNPTPLLELSAAIGSKDLS